MGRPAIRSEGEVSTPQSLVVNRNLKTFVFNIALHNSVLGAYSIALSFSITLCNLSKVCTLEQFNIFSIIMESYVKFTVTIVIGV